MKIKPDNTPEIRPAGIKVLHARETASDCLDHADSETFTRHSKNPSNMRRKLALNVTSLTQRASKMTHGDVYPIADQVRASEILNPRRSLNQVVIEGIREQQYHRSEIGKPVFRSSMPLQCKGEVFGVKSQIGENVRNLLYPSQSTEPLQSTSSATLQTPAKFSRTVPTLSQVRLYCDGHRTSHLMKWHEKSTHLTDRRLESFKERTRCQLGQVHDPIKETMAHLPPSHVFGLNCIPDDCGVPQLIHPTPPQLENQILTGKINNLPFNNTQPARAFGDPTVLAGCKPKYYVKSLGDNNNYGDEVSVRELLSPGMIHAADYQRYNDLLESRRGQIMPLLPQKFNKINEHRGLVKQSPFAMTRAESRCIQMRRLNLPALSV